MIYLRLDRNNNNNQQQKNKSDLFIRSLVLSISGRFFDNFCNLNIYQYSQTCHADFLIHIFRIFRTVNIFFFVVEEVSLLNQTRKNIKKSNFINAMLKLELN